MALWAHHDMAQEEGWVLPSAAIVPLIVFYACCSVPVGFDKGLASIGVVEEIYTDQGLEGGFDRLIMCPLLYAIAAIDCPADVSFQLFGMKGPLA